MATSISNVTGTFGLSNSLTIAGSGFGTKTRSKPFSYCDFQNGSIQPNSAVSFSTALASSENVGYVSSTQNRWGNGGLGSATWLRNSTSGGNAATLQVSTSWGFSNRKLFVHAYRKWLNADTTGNWKTWRFWPGTNGGGGYPDSYLGCPTIQGPSGWVWSIEGVSFTNNVNHLWLATGLQPTSTWRSETLFMTHNSSSSVNDGALKIYFDGPGGNVIADATGFSFCLPGSSTTSSVVYLQDVLASQNVSGSMNSFYSDYYVDDSHNQVFMGDAATFAACTHIEVQPFTAWADGSITVTQRTGTFSSGTGTYLYVTDVNGDPNSTGYQLNNLNQNPSPPTLTLITPVSGPAVGGTAIAGTCTGLTASLNNAKIGGTACTSVVRVSPTQFTAVTPAKAAGIYNATVENSDGTTGTLNNAFTAVAAPVVTTCALQVSSYRAFLATPSFSYNLAPHWSQVSAGYGPLDVVINGTGFQTGAGATFASIPGGTPVAATNVRVQSSTKILCDITGALTGGLQMVTVINPDGQTSGSSGGGAFTANANTWIFGVRSLPTVGDGLLASSVAYVYLNPKTDGNIVSWSIGGNTSTSPVLSPGGPPAGYGIWPLLFKAPAHAVGAVDATLTASTGGAYTLTGGAIYYVQPTSSGATGIS